MTAQVVTLIPSPASPSYDGQAGLHNFRFEESRERIIKGHTYKGLGTIMVTPVRKGGMLHKRFVESKDALIKPPNHPFAAWLVEGFEVGDAFNRAVWGILQNPSLMSWNDGRGPFVFTVEDDNLVPPDALTRLLEDMYSGPWAAVSGLYWTKGEGGVPQAWGDPKSSPVSFVPQAPLPNTIQEVRGLGMGCCLFDIALFKDPRVRQGMNPDGCPIWFKTWAEWDPNAGTRVGTQDLSLWNVAQKFGYRCAVDTSIRVGHVDWNTGIVW